MLGCLCELYRSCCFFEDHSEVKHIELDLLAIYCLLLTAVLSTHTAYPRLELLLHPLHHNACTADLALLGKERGRPILQCFPNCLHCAINVDVLYSKAGIF